jgi:ketosteroid isomerase-like protein
LWLVPLLVACGAAPSGTPEVAVAPAALVATADSWLTALERSLENAERARSADASARGVVAAHRARLTRDAIFEAPNQPLLRGRAAIEAWLATEDATVKSTYEPRRISVSADGLIGYSFGWNVYAVASPKPYGKYMTVWRHEEDGWREWVHVANLTSVAPSPAPVTWALLDPADPLIRLALPSVTEAQIEDTDVRFAADSVAHGTAIAFPDFAASDAVELAGPIQYGYADVKAAHAGDDPAEVLDWAPAAAGGSFSGDLGWTVGTYTDSYDDNGPKVAYGKYLTVWRRQSDGGWKWIGDTGNASPAP